MWSLKVIGQKLKSLSCPQGKAWRTHTHPHTHSLTQPPTNGRVTISHPTLLWGDNTISPPTLLWGDNKERMVIVLMTNSVLYETFDDHRSIFIFIFLWINRVFFFAKTYVLLFPPLIIECIETLESIHSRGTVPCATSSLRQREQCDKYVHKIWWF